MQNEKKRSGKIKPSTVQALLALLVFVFVGIGLVFATGTGTLSSFGFGAIAAICPLGSLESMFGTLSFIPRAAIVFVLVALFSVVLGKAFCAWVCPVPHIGNIFKSKKKLAAEERERHDAAVLATKNWEEGTKPERKPVTLDSRHAILGGTLLSTAIFGFPVFCMVCPIGLTFATFILFWRFVQFNDASIGLLVFPLIVILEVVVLKKWCGRICPMGALLSLISSLNKTFRPTVDASKCLRDTGKGACNACAASCPEHIDPYGDLGERPMTECVKCKNCSTACPASAITFPLLRKGEGKDAAPKS